MADVRAALTAMLSAERGGKKLSDGFVLVVVNYLVDVALVSDVDKVELKDLKDVFAEAWAGHSERPMPKMLERDNTAWLRGELATNSAPRSTLSVDGGDDLDDDCDETTIFGMEPGAKDIKALEDDKQAQGLSSSART